MKNTLKSRFTLFAAAATLTMSAHVGAATVTLNSALGEWTDTSPTLPVVNVDNTSSIRWGRDAGYGQSGYDYTAEAPPVVEGIPLGTEFLLGKFTHHNYPIYAPALNHATLSIDYDIDIVDGGVIDSFTGTSTYLFKHDETLNSANPCADGNANGSGVNASGCADLVTFAINDALTDSFTKDGLTYQLVLTGFLLQDGTIASEFWTAEHLSNHAYLVGMVTAVPLPAAAPLFATVLGLFGLLRLRSRKNTALSSA